MTTMMEQLKSRNLKVTPQRLAIYNMLTNTKAHPSAETIYNAIIKDFPTMSLATVYKTLESFCAVNLAQELNLGEQRFRYDASTEPHPHITCTVCHRVDDVMDFEQSDSLRIHAQEKTDYIITSEQLYFYGICASCQNRQTKAASWG